ncbi:MAG: DUF58 domain-containing protein [Chloroflexota bacterium]
MTANTDRAGLPPTEPEAALPQGIPPELLRTIRRIEIRCRRLVNSLFLGEYHAVFRGRGMEFSEVREYQLGDDVRTIDWNVTARMGAPYVKKFVEERELTVMLVVDVSGSAAFGSGGQSKREVAAEVGALLALAAVRSNDRVGLLAFTDRVERYVPPRKGTRHVLRVIRELLYLQPAGRRTCIGAAVDFLEGVLHRRSVIFLLSDFQDRGYDAPLRVLARRHDVTAIVVHDAREFALPPVGLVEVEDAETGERRLIDTTHPRVRALYAARAAAQQEERRRLLAAMSIDQVELSTGASYVEPLVAYFRRRAGRAGLTHGGARPR